MTGTNHADPAAPPDELTRAVLTAPLWLPPKRCSTRGIAAAIGTSQSRVARLSRSYPVPSRAAEELAVIVAHEHLTIAAAAVTASGSHVLLQSAGGPGGHDYAPVSARNRLRLRALLAARTVREHIGPARHARANDDAPFWTRVERAATAGSATVLTTARGAVPADRTAGARVLRCGTDREWHGLLAPLCELAEPLVDEALGELEQRLRRWYRHPEAPFAWLASSDEPGAPTDAVRSRPSASPAPAAAPPDDGGLAPGARTGSRAIEDDLLREIQSGVEDGTFEIGDDISVRVLADRLGVGRARVHRAIQSLAEEGLVTVTAGSGVAVRLPSASDVLEMYAARRALGSISVRAASRRRDLDLHELDALVNGLARSARAGDSASMQRFDSEFQVALAHASGLSRIPAMLDSFTKQLVMFITLMGVHYDYPADLMHAQDARLLVAIRANDQEAAVRAWQEKMDAGARYMLGQMRLLNPTRPQAG